MNLSSTILSLNVSMPAMSPDNDHVLRCSNSSVVCEQIEPLDLSSSKLPPPPPLTDTFTSSTTTTTTVSPSRPLIIRRTSAGYPCQHCSYISKRASDLRRHQLVHNSTARRYRCPYCTDVERSYKLQFDLGRHLSRVHGVLSSAATAIQPAGTATARLSSASPRLAAKPVLAAAPVKMVCPYCEYVGSSLGELERHARLHSGERPYNCHYCNQYSTCWKTDMKLHLQKVHSCLLVAGGGQTALEQLLETVCTNNNDIKTTSGATDVDINMNDVEQKSLVTSPPLGKTTVLVTPLTAAAPVALNTTPSAGVVGGGKRFACTRCGLKFWQRSDARNHVSLEHSEIVDPNRVIIGEMVSSVAALFLPNSTMTMAAPVSTSSLEPVQSSYSSATIQQECPAIVKLPAVDINEETPAVITTAGTFRPYQCSQCGKRSNWRWDIKKHIRVSRHPHAEVCFFLLLSLIHQQ